MVNATLISTVTAAPNVREDVLAARLLEFRYQEFVVLLGDALLTTTPFPKLAPSSATLLPLWLLLTLLLIL